MSLNLNDEQLQIAAQIDDRMRELEKSGCDEMTIVTEMTPYMVGFKILLDTAGQHGMDELCRRFDSFYHYAKILDRLAGDIQSGRIRIK